MGTAQEVRRTFANMIGEKYDLSFEERPALDVICDAYLEDVASLLTPVQKADKFLRLGPALTAGRAMAAALRKLAALPDLSEKSRNVILSDISWIVPTVVTAAE